MTRSEIAEKNKAIRDMRMKHSGKFDIQIHREKKTWQEKRSRKWLVDISLRSEKGISQCRDIISEDELKEKGFRKGMIDKIENSIRLCCEQLINHHHDEISKLMKVAVKHSLEDRRQDFSKQYYEITTVIPMVWKETSNYLWEMKEISEYIKVQL